MKSIASSTTMTRAACAMASAIALLIAGCGGGGDAPPGTTPAIGSAGPDTSTGGPGNGSDSIRMNIALKASGGGATSLGLGKPMTVTVTVLDKAGKPVSNALVAFSIDAALVAMTPAQGQVATDANGQANMTLAAAGITGSGATVLTVLAQYNGMSVQGQTTVTVTEPKITLNRITPATSPALLAAYGSSVVTLDAFSDGTLLSSVPLTINLSSTCVGIERANMPASVTTLAGRAQFTYKDNGCAQSDTIVATVAETGASVNVQLAAASPDATSVELAGITPADSSIVIQGAGGSGRSETAQVRFKVRDKSAAPVGNQYVTFSTISTKTVRLSQTSGTTDVNGEVVAHLNSGTEPTSVRVVATLGNGLSTVSDTITVTTGLPTQAAFSLSAEKFNIEGYDFDDVQGQIKLLLADQFSNPVADGVPVVFQTDSAAIGTSARGGCTTVNGRCTVDLRSQNPRFGDDATAPQKRAGLATIQVSTLAGSDLPLTGQIAVFLSGSHAGNISMVRGPQGAALTDAGLTVTTAGCGVVSVDLRISDNRRNPMPAETNIGFESGVKMGTNVYPSTVPSVAPRYIGGFVTGDQGSVHSLALIPEEGTCEEGGPKSIAGSGLLVVRTPLGMTTLLPIKLNYRGKADPQ